MNNTDAEKLYDTYKRIKKILGEEAYTVEPLASVQLVEQYRKYWKPEKVRIILLAESHVYTSNDDRRIIIPSSVHLPGYPAHYARFVYCLGHGERELTKSTSHPRGGTPQFWKLFYSCNNSVSNLDGFSPILRKTADEQRVKNKIQLLKDLKSRGIWLVDASIVGLYRDGEKPTSMPSAIESSWQHYTREVVMAVNPEYVICIGEGVAHIVENDLKRHFPDKYTVIPQPNAYLSSEEHMKNYQKYTEICSTYGIPLK